MLINVEVLGTYDSAEYVDRQTLIAMDVNYVCTDFESGYDIYEDNMTGALYCTDEE